MTGGGVALQPLSPGAPESWGQLPTGEWAEGWAGRPGSGGRRGASQGLLVQLLLAGRQDSCTTVLQKGQARGKTSLLGLTPCQVLAGRTGVGGSSSVPTVTVTPGPFQVFPVCIRF